MKKKTVMQASKASAPVMVVVVITVVDVAEASSGNESFGSSEAVVLIW